MNTKAIAQRLFQRRASKQQISLYLDNLNIPLDKKREVVAELTNLVHDSINNWAEC